mmetsp:Transcript_15669/g.23737  ORF Transcript_15669/g.23737 Transcript_15669/m.23737 type:complete len:245 (-) Transcript_15669:351-1085(-)|eukprot:CAMPEP_0178907304 /NCGR_PEP_ID=MMETSP0786-20121207/7295_1 /TAXON_ID=186022 /ORGANISM="Thalassionema frauenfeldii, Strain CCMP 1798" /LENGTH=244 /DNA_ID=CAMNT_0020579085 /DNA_START=406 /DNA_END=1140 /DNA_ORIENTATION=+
MRVANATITLSLLLVLAFIGKALSLMSQTRIDFKFVHSYLTIGYLNGKPKISRNRMFAVSSCGPDESFTITVSHEGMTGEITVHRNETILAALERQSDSLCLTQLPFECRRGNCLTCVGHVAGKDEKKTGSYDAKENILQVEDGLPPYMSDQLRSSDQLLLCSSYITGPGVSIALGNDYPKNHIQWNYGRQRERERIKLAATAKLFRMQAEQNLHQWKEDTEKTLLQKQDTDIFSDDDITKMEN